MSEQQPQSKVTAPEEMGDKSLQSNWSNVGNRALGEIMELATRNTWMSYQPISEQQYEQLRLPQGFVKSGHGIGAMDLAYFRRSPDAPEDGPLQTMQVDGYLFMHVARPEKIEKAPDGSHYQDLKIIQVNKHHNLLFRAGRTVEVISCPNAMDYILVVASSIGFTESRPDSKRYLPKGWTSRQVSLETELLVELPCPTRALFFDTGESFQGPINLAM